MNADQIREQLRQAAGETTEASIALGRAKASARRALSKVQATEGISMTEAAEILGVSRFTAYQMLKD